MPEPVDLALGRALAKGAVPESLRRRWGVVSVINATTVDVTVGGVVIPGVSYLAGYDPTAGDVVVVDFNGSDPLVLGALGAGRMPQSLFYTATLANGTATSFTDFSTHNAEGSLAVPYTMVVQAYVSHGANGAANTATWQVRDQAGTNINYKGVTMEVLTDWPARQPINTRMTTVLLGRQTYAANVTCGFRLAYKVDTSNVYADVGIRVDLIPQ